MMRAREVASVCCGAVVGLLLSLAATVPAAAQSYPLPPWYFYGGGNGSTWNGSSTSPDNAQLEVTLYAPPFAGQYGMAVATGSTGLGQITPLTTYTLTFWAVVSGSGSAQSLWVDGVGTITSVAVSGSTWKRYTNSFAIGNPDDARVGRNLNVQLLLSRFTSLGTVSASFTNIQLQVATVRPTLSYHRPAPGTLQLLCDELNKE